MAENTIKREYIPENIFDQIRGNIFRGDLKTGDRLIPENELAEMLSVSRGSVKKAMKLLVDNGYAEKRVGGGYYITEQEQSVAIAPFSGFLPPRDVSLEELLEVRIGLECHGAEMAARSAKKMDVELLQRVLAKFQENHANGAAAGEADLKFHMGVAFSTHNSVYIELTRRFHDYLFHSIERLHSLLYEQKQNLDIIDKQHYKICDAISNGDSQGARRYMHQHITFLRSLL